MSRIPVTAGMVLLLAAGVASARNVDEALALARKTLDLVERSEARPEFAKTLAAMERRGKLPAGQEPLSFDEVMALRRRIILSHPALNFDRLLINKRSRRIPGHMCDQYLGRHSQPGQGLVVLESWKDNPRAVPLLEGKLPPGAVMHPDLSFDAKRAIFAFCDHSVSGDRNRRSYFIYEVDLATGKVRQLTGTARDRFTGAHGRQTVLIEDYDPCYLPDGGFAFVSTRSQQYGRCHGSRYVPAYVLYRADADGGNIRRLSYNEANEWDPAVLNDGRLIYCRWDYINRHDTNFQSLWVSRTDGTAVGHYYGNYSVGPCMITEARPIPGSHKVVATATDHHGSTAGSILVIDPRKGEDGGAPLTVVTPEIRFPERRAPAGTTMTDPPLHRGRGRAATPFPLTEDIFLAAYNTGGQYAIYLIDTLGGRELIYQDPNTSCFAPIPIRPVARPPVVASMLPATGEPPPGRFFVKDVYQSTQPIERGTIKAMRISKIIPQPTRSKPRLSRVANEIIKKVLGTVPVAADGSVAFEAPSATPLQFQLLDANGMAVMTMRSLVYAQPGEQVGCVGCHESRRKTSVAAAPRSNVHFQKIRPAAGPQYPGGLSFARTVQPVLDRYCIRCHGLEKTEGSVNLLGEPSGFNRAYDSLTRGRGLVAMAHRNSETVYSKPKDYYAHAGRLAGMLLEGHPAKDGTARVKLDRESFQRIADWLDLNGQYFGDYSFNRAEQRGQDAEGAKALREYITERFGGDLAGQPYHALVNVALPSESRILLAPLPTGAGGWGQVTKGGWASKSDPAFRKMQALVAGAIARPGRRDIAGTCGAADSDRRCRCGTCWVRQVRAERQKHTVAARDGE